MNLAKSLWGRIFAGGLVLAAAGLMAAEVPSSPPPASAEQPAEAPAAADKPAASDLGAAEDAELKLDDAPLSAEPNPSAKAPVAAPAPPPSAPVRPAVRPTTVTESLPAPAPEWKEAGKSERPSQAASDATHKPAAAAPVAKRGPQDEFNELIEQAIQDTGRRKLTAGVHTPWQVAHGILAQRWDLRLQNKQSAGDVSGIEWMFSGQFYDGMPLWEETPYGGRGHTYTKPYAFEGHPTQFMGYMSMADIPLDYEVQTPTKVITVRDIIKDAKMQVRQGVEITWTLWTLAHYEEPDSQWFNAAGEPWSIERLVKLQVDEPVTSGACGGCHGLFALAYARNMYLSTGKPLRGVWFEADQKIKRYIQEARALQNPDGTFSTNHFKGPGFSEDFGTRIATSGHQLEWLMIALPQSKLKETWFRKGITAVANDLIKNRNVASDCGPLYHAMHALVVYRQRTVPGYLMPQFNSHIKLSERGKAPAATDQASPGAAQEARRTTDSERPSTGTLNPPPPVKAATIGASAASATRDADRK